MNDTQFPNTETFQHFNTDDPDDNLLYQPSVFDTTYHRKTMTQSQKDDYVRTLLQPYTDRANDRIKDLSDQSDTDSNGSENDDSSDDSSNVSDQLDHTHEDVHMSLTDLEENDVSFVPNVEVHQRNDPLLFLPATHQNQNNDNLPKYFTNLTDFQVQLINSWRNLTIDEPTICSLKLLKLLCVRIF